MRGSYSLSCAYFRGLVGRIYGEADGEASLRVTGPFFVLLLRALVGSSVNSAGCNGMEDEITAASTGTYHGKVTVTVTFTASRNGL